MPRGTIHTYNLYTNPFIRQGLSGYSIYMGDNNGFGRPTNNHTYFPFIPNEHPIPFVIGEDLIPQVVGFIPLIPCDTDDCRTYPESEYINPVLASEEYPDDIYKNDSNTFLISFLSYYSSFYILTITLQKIVGGTWTDDVALDNNDYGIYLGFEGKTIISNLYPTGIWNTTHPEYAGYIIDWQKVLNYRGEGEYRIKINIASINIYKNAKNYCGASIPFCLREYSCENAQNTVKFEITLKDGVIGDSTNPAYLIDLCGITYTDSIRFEGFFGYEKDEYDRKNIEYNNGIIYKVRDEVIKKFDLQTGRLPKWLHDRFRAYGLLAGGGVLNYPNESDRLLVSDYNDNNPDYNIKRKGVIADSGYEPVWIQNTRTARVRCSFKEDQQNLIRRKCCTS